MSRSFDDVSQRQFSFYFIFDPPESINIEKVLSSKYTHLFDTRLIKPNSVDNAIDDIDAVQIFGDEDDSSANVDILEDVDETVDDDGINGREDEVRDLSTNDNTKDKIRSQRWKIVPSCFEAVH